MNQSIDKDLKRFDTWEEVNCDQCSRYWDSSCDGTKKGDKRICHTYVATRNIVIPEQIAQLKKNFNALARSNIILGIALIIHILSDMFGG